MPAPSVVTTPVGEWTLVVSNVTSATIHVLKRNASVTGYAQTYRPTGDAAPTLITEGVGFKDAFYAGAPVAIDLYVWAHGTAGESGQVRVDTMDPP